MDVRYKFEAFCDMFFKGGALLVSRYRNEIMKDKRNAEYLAMLDKSIAEAEAGGFVVKSLDELEDYE